MKKRADIMSGKVETNSISPPEVGGLIRDLIDYVGNIEINGALIGIRKTYHTVENMQDDKEPKDNEGKALRPGSLVLIDDGADVNKVFRYDSPGWTYLYTLPIADLTPIWTVLYTQHSIAGLEVAPSLIEKGVPNAIHLSWTVRFNDKDMEPDKIVSLELKDGDELITGDKAVRDYTQSGVTDSKTYTLNVMMPFGVPKAAVAKVVAYYPFYIGSSGKTEDEIKGPDITGFAKQPLRSAPSGTYTVDIANDGEYIYICVPSGMTVKSATMGGQPFTFASPVTVAVEEKGNYLVYRSVWAQDAGKITFTVN